MVTRWLPGTWLGKTRSCDEHVVSVESGEVPRAKCVWRMPGELSWSADRRFEVTAVRTHEHD